MRIRRDLHDGIVPLLATVTLQLDSLRRRLPADDEGRGIAEDAKADVRRAMGDLRENFEYKSARQRHEYLNARASALNADLQRSRPIETGGMDATEVRIGSRMRFTDGRVVTILGPWESKPEEDVISYESDLAKELLGKKVGDEVSVGRIASIEPWR